MTNGALKEDIKPIMTNDRPQAVWYGLIVFSAMLYSLVGLLVQLATDDISTMEATLARGLVQGCFCLFSMRGTKSRKAVTFLPDLQSDRNLVYGRATVGAVGFIFYFHAVAVLPLGDGLTVASLYPISATIATRIILKEKVHWTAILAMTTAIAGVIMVCQPHFIFEHIEGTATENATLTESFITSRGISNVTGSIHNTVSMGSHIDSIIKSRTAGYISGLIASTLVGISYVFFRAAKNVHSLQFMASYSVSTVVLSLALSASLPGQELKMPKSVVVGFYLLGQGLLASVAQYLFIFGSTRLPSARASVIQISDIVWGYALQVTVFHVVPNGITAIGAFIVLAGSVMVVLARNVGGGGTWGAPTKTPLTDSADVPSLPSNIDLDAGKKRVRLAAIEADESISVKTVRSAFGDITNNQIATELQESAAKSTTTTAL